MNPWTNAARRLLLGEILGLRERLLQLRPFSLQMPMVSAARISQESQMAIDSHLACSKTELLRDLTRYQGWFEGEVGRMVCPSEAQRKLNFLRLKFQALLSELDIFADVVSQRSEHDFGVWVAGLDALAEDGLRVDNAPYVPPPLVTYLDRGQGAAIRRVRTRLPGGKHNPVAVIRVPRERMVGMGIGSSLIHEVGHQAIALLGVLPELENVLETMGRSRLPGSKVYEVWKRWLSEILADFWSVSKLGIASTLGLMSVLSLPMPLMFLAGKEDPHPFPWIRGHVSIAMGKVMFPDPQWDMLGKIWWGLYPPSGQSSAVKQRLLPLLQTVDTLAAVIAGHRPKSFGGKTLREALNPSERSPVKLRRWALLWKKGTKVPCTTSPTGWVAMLGQARWDGVLSVGEEAKILRGLLTCWATRGAHHGCNVRTVEKR
ncbi:MAG: hypothetical protein HUU55_05045 [Myxococcales bacterium]|nr:hypothetical protein [Myxococcales bacterium]